MNNSENRFVDPSEKGDSEQPKDREGIVGEILAKINAALKELGSDAQWLKAPEFKPEYEPLANKRVVMVDDVKGVLENMIPELIAATKGNAVPIHFAGEDIDNLVARIQKENPDLVLLDYHLSDNLKGSAVTTSLRSQGYDKLILGFSSDTELMLSFSEAGADGSVVKEPGFPEESVEAIAKCLSGVERDMALLKKREQGG